MEERNDPIEVFGALKLQDVLMRDRLDEEMGFGRYTEGPSRLGWLVNMHEV